MQKDIITYQTSGTCSRVIHLEIEDGLVTHCSFERGCYGNAQGICRLVKGQKVEDVIEKLSGIQCQNGTSCPDQLATALSAWKDKKQADKAVNHEETDSNK